MDVKYVFNIYARKGGGVAQKNLIASRLVAGEIRLQDIGHEAPINVVILRRRKHARFPQLHRL